MNLRQALPQARAAWNNKLSFAAALVLFSSPAMALQTAPVEEKDVTVGSMIQDSGIFGWLIIALSILAVMLILMNFFTLKREKLAPPELVDEMHSLFEEEQFQEALELCETEENFFLRVCQAGIAKVNHPFEVIEKSLEEMGDEEAVKLHQKIGWLSLIANVAPMMGLLGTVFGMVKAFNTIATTQGQASPAELADGISQALLTTMFGLLVAIPTTAAFAYLRNNLITSVIEVGAMVEDLFERFRPTS